MKISEHIAYIQKEAGKQRIVFVHGNFNILHPGHLRLLKFAKDNGNYLVVGIHDGNASETLLPASIRLEAVQHSMYVNYALIISDDIAQFIEKLHPSIVVKGNEYRNQYNLEKEILASYGGRLIFSSGDIGFSSMELLRSEFENLNTNFIDKPNSFIERQTIDPIQIKKHLLRFQDLNIIVIGDTIVDEYITCNPLGMSQEDPTIVVTPISSDLFIGGAAIVASHAAGLGANIDFYSVLGDDANYQYVQKKLPSYGVKCHLFQDTSRPTTLKQRFRAQNKTLLRVNHLKQHHIDVELQNQIYNEIAQQIHKTDLIIFSDFSYGCLPQNLIDNIIELGSLHRVMMVADSQSSSQVGDISKFHSMRLVTPTEKEARLALNDFESGLIILAEKLRKRCNIANIFITLGSEGLLIHADKEGTEWTTDQLPALNRAPKDVAGAGDSLLTAASMALAVGATIMEAAYIGSIAAACQVGRVGNIPLNIKEVEQEIIG